MKLLGPNLIYNISVGTKAFRIDSYCIEALTGEGCVQGAGSQ